MELPSASLWNSHLHFYGTPICISCSGDFSNFFSVSTILANDGRSAGSLSRKIAHYTEERQLEKSSERILKNGAYPTIQQRAG